MSDGAWLMISQVISTIVLALIGYVSLRYKASVEYVAGLEAIVEKLKKSVTALESDYEKCQQERRKLLEKNSDMASEIVDLKAEKLTKEVIKEEKASQQIAESTSAIQSLVEKLDKKEADASTTKVEVVPGAKPLPVKETP